MARALQAILLLVLACLATPAAAHPAPFSFIDLRLDAGGARGALTVHDYDLVHELSLASADELQNHERLHELRDPLIALIDQRLHLTIDGTRITPLWGEIEAVPDRQSVRISFTLDRPVRSGLTVEGLLFPYDPSHQSFINVYANGAIQQQAVLSVDRPSTHYYPGSVQGRLTLIATFVQSGIRHIAIGFDHICFLIGLITLGGTLKRLALIVTAFTISHSITLTLATLGLLQLPPAPVEALIALSIVVVGVDNILVLRDQARGAAIRDIRAPLAGAFGLLHGFGFAGVLAEAGLPTGALAWSLAAFNIGVEIGQLIIVVLFVGAGRLIARTGLMTPNRTRLAAFACSAAVTAFGAFWLAQRIGI